MLLDCVCVVTQFLSLQRFWSLAAPVLWLLWNNLLLNCRRKWDKYTYHANAWKRKPWWVIIPNKYQITIIYRECWLLLYHWDERIFCYYKTIWECPGYAGAKNYDLPHRIGVVVTMGTPCGEHLYFIDFIDAQKFLRTRACASLIPPKRGDCFRCKNRGCGQSKSVSRIWGPDIKVHDYMLEIHFKMFISLTPGRFDYN